MHTVRLASLMDVQILFFRGDSAPNVALLLVYVQHLPRLCGKRWVRTGQTLGDIFMYGRFADTEFYGGGANRRLILNDVLRQPFGALLHVSFQDATLPTLFTPAYAPGGADMRWAAVSLGPPQAWTVVHMDERQCPPWAEW